MELLCRDRSGVFNSTFFRLWTCSMCYTYLFHGSKPVFEWNGLSNSSQFPGVAIRPEGDNPKALILNCSALDDSECNRWKLCCRAAEECCQDQNMITPLLTEEKGRSSTDDVMFTFYFDIGSTQAYETSLSDSDSVDLNPGSGYVSDVSRLLESESGRHSKRQKYCPRTWDGFGCFRDTPAGQTASINCPLYIDQTRPGARAYKQCTENGTWYTSAITKQEWTDYTLCVPLEAFRIVYYVSLICNVISLALLVPSIVIFVAYKKLRTQHRVQIHIHLFLSFVLTNVIQILWNNIVYNDRLLHTAVQTLMYKDSPGCKTLYALTRYSWTCNYFWMFIEGFHLHRLIVRAFETPKSIFAYYVLGWGGPLIPLTVYVVIRVLRQDSGCWVHNIYGFEWIIHSVNLFCLAANVFFLASILRILLTQLQSHPNEPSSYRRALKATAILVPLFGLQFVLFIYNPEANRQVFHIYEIVETFVNHSQGALVALIFCFFNKQVREQVHIQLKRSRSHRLRWLTGTDRELKALTFHTFVKSNRKHHSQPDVIPGPTVLKKENYLALTTDTPRLSENGNDVDVFI